MATNQEFKYVVLTPKERLDFNDGWERGYSNPYPRVNAETILANIGKVSPAFVAGYKAGKLDADLVELRAQAEQDAEEVEEFFRDLDR